MILRKLLADCRWPNRDENQDVVHQQFQLPRRRPLVLHSISETTLSSTSKSNSDSYCLDQDLQIGASNSQKMDTSNKRGAVPVLFSTNRGLYLRVPKKTLSSFHELPTGGDLASDFNISFCDLERWSTNRAHTISLEDTFTIARSIPQPMHAESPQPLQIFVPNRRICFAQHCNNNQFMPIKRVGRFYNAFSRFETRY